MQEMLLGIMPSVSIVDASIAKMNSNMKLGGELDQLFISNFELEAILNIFHLLISSLLMIDIVLRKIMNAKDPNIIPNPILW